MSSLKKWRASRAKTVIADPAPADISVLTRLRKRPQPLDDDHPGAHASAEAHAVARLCEAGLIRLVHEYHITPEGQAALTQMVTPPCQSNSSTATSSHPPQTPS